MVVEKITEKKAKLGLDLGIAYLVPVLSHKTTQAHTHEDFSFPFGILGNTLLCLC